MEYRNLGSTGLKISLLSLGTMGFDDVKRKDTYTELIKKAFEIGINYFDTSEAYSGNLSEELLGYSLQKLKIPREDIVLSTKIFYGKGFGHPHSNQQKNSLGLSRKHIIESTLRSLEKLKTEYIDVIFCHRFDPETPLEETCRAMNWLIEHGKALYWGTCEWPIEQIIYAKEICEKLDMIPPTVEQIQYNFLERKKLELEYLPLLEKNKGGVCVFSLLGGGLLGESPIGRKCERRNSMYEASPPIRMMSDPDQIELNYKGLKGIAKELNCTMPEFAIAWGLKHPDVATAIMGWKKPLEIEESLHAMSKIPLISNEIEEKVECLLKNCPKGEFDWKNMKNSFLNKRMF